MLSKFGLEPHSCVPCSMYGVYGLVRFLTAFYIHGPVVHSALLDTRCLMRFYDIILYARCTRHLRFLTATYVCMVIAFFSAPWVLFTFFRITYVCMRAFGGK